MAHRKLKAYAVQELDERTGGIVFARGPAHARKLGSSMFGSGEDDWGEATRASWADGYSNANEVPASAMVDAGWFFECSGCGQTIAEGEEDDDGKEIDFAPVGNQHCAYCRPECANRAALRKQETQILECQAALTTYRKLLEKFPGVWVWGKPHVYVSSGEVRQVRLSFRFPGCKIGDAHYGFDKVGEEPTVTVCNGDLAAWEAWRATAEPNRRHVPQEP